MKRINSTLCPWAKNECSLKNVNSPHTWLLMLIFEWHMPKGVISWPVKQFSTFSILAKLLHAKNQLYLPRFLWWKIQFIAIPIGAKYQQGNVIPWSICLCMHSSWDQTSNSFTWKISFPTYPSSPRDASIARSSGSIYITW